MSDGCLFDLLSLVQHAEWEERLECTSLPLQAWLKQNRAGTSQNEWVQDIFAKRAHGCTRFAKGVGGAWC